MEDLHYDTCPECGANLDPDEQCDCQEKHWYVEAEMPNGRTINTKINGSGVTICKHFEQMGAELLKLEKIA